MQNREQGPNMRQLRGQTGLYFQTAVSEMVRPRVGPVYGVTVLEK